MTRLHVDMVAKVLAYGGCADFRHALFAVAAGARRHGVKVRRPDVMFSDVDCSLEGLPHLLAVYGHWQREGDLMNLIALNLKDLTPWLGRLGTASRDFH